MCFINKDIRSGIFVTVDGVDGAVVPSRTRSSAAGSRQPSSRAVNTGCASGLDALRAPEPVDRKYDYIINNHDW